MKTLVCVLAVLAATAALARPGPQWDSVPQEIRQWFQNLKQPDIPTMSCCGEADAFEADDFEIEGDQYVAVITDGKGVIADGTRVPVPNKKIQWQQGNPTGHGIIFLSGAIAAAGEEGAIKYGRENGYTYVAVAGFMRVLYCYVPPTGV